MLQVFRRMSVVHKICFHEDQSLLGTVACFQYLKHKKKPRVNAFLKNSVFNELQPGPCPQK